MQIFHAAILAARFDDLIKILPIFLFLIFWVMGQIAEAKKKARLKMPGQSPATMPTATPAAGTTDNKPAPADPLRQQVDDFLRRAERQTTTAATPGAGESAKARPTRTTTADRDRIEILLPGASTSSNRPPLSAPQPPATTASAPPGTASQSRPQRVSKRRSQSVAEHVAEHVTSAVKQISDEASRLGERVASADKQFGAQLQQKFDHEIGTFGDRRGALAQEQRPAAEVVVNPALEIAAMLSGGDGMRRAVILNEIFRRPEERWQ